VVVLSVLDSPLAEPDALAEPVAPCVAVPVVVPVALLVLLTSPPGVFTPEAFSEPALPAEAPELSAAAFDSDLALAASRAVVGAGGSGLVAGIELGNVVGFVVAAGTEAFVAIGPLAT
jgi:hypothetical protein